MLIIRTNLCGQWENVTAIKVGSGQSSYGDVVVLTVMTVPCASGTGTDTENIMFILERVCCTSEFHKLAPLTVLAPIPFLGWMDKFRVSLFSPEYR